MSLATRIAEEFNTVRSQAVAKELVTVKANTTTNGYVKKGELVYGNTPNTFHEEASILNINGELFSTEGVELVTNGDFSDGTTGWTSHSGSTLSVDNGRLKAVGTSAYDGAIQDVSVIAGKTYLIEYQYETVGSTTVTIGASKGDINNNGIGTRTFTYTADDNTLELIFNTQTTVGTFYIDNISVKELTEIKLPPAPTAKVETSTTTTNAYNIGEFAVLDRPELVTNGTFDVDTNWIKDTGWTIGSGAASRTATGTNTGITQALNLVVGRVYNISLDINSLSGGNATLYIQGSTIASFSTAGSYTVKYTATTTNTSFSVFGIGNAVVTIDNISVKQVDEIYQATTNTTVGALLTDTSKFEVCDRVFAGDISFHRLHKTTKALDTVSFRTLGNNPKLEYETGLYTADEIAMQPLADMSNNVVKNLNKAGSDLYEDSDYYYVMITATPRLNQGAFHPVFNSLGTSSFGNTTFGLAGRAHWYDSTVLPSDTIALVFENKTTSTSDNGSIVGGASLYYGRPDSKFYDKIYDSGLGGTIPLRINAKEYSPQELLEIGKARATNPDFVEYGVECGYNVGISVSQIQFIYSTSTNQFRVYDLIGGQVEKSYWSKGDKITIHFVYNGTTYSVIGSYTGIWGASNGHYFDLIATNATLPTSWVNIGLEGYYYTKQSKIPTYKTSTTVDVIGNPSNYPALWLDRLAEGKSLDFNPLLVEA